MNPSASADAVIGSLVFKFGIQEVALEGMEHFGDTESASFFLAIKSRLKASGAFPDLSQELPSGVLEIRPTGSEALASLSDLISAYDAARLDPRRNSRIQLRRTIEAVYELVDTLREQQISDSEAKEVLSKENLLNKSLASLPLRPGQIKSLNSGGFRILKDLFGLGTLDIRGRCGLTDRQVEAIDEIITNYVIVTIRTEDVPVMKQLQLIGQDVFGVDFKLAEASGQQASSILLALFPRRKSYPRSGANGWERRVQLLERSKYIEDRFRNFLQEVKVDFSTRSSWFSVKALAKYRGPMASLPDWRSMWASHQAEQANKNLVAD